MKNRPRQDTKHRMLCALQLLSFVFLPVLYLGTIILETVSKCTQEPRLIEADPSCYKLLW